MNKLSLYYIRHWLWNDIKDIPSTIKWVLMEWYLINFKAKHVTKYHVFMKNDSFFCRRNPIFTDYNWMNNARIDRDKYYSLMRCSEHCGNTVSPK